MPTESLVAILTNQNSFLNSISMNTEVHKVTELSSICLNIPAANHFVSGRRQIIDNNFP